MDGFTEEDDDNDETGGGFNIPNMESFSSSVPRNAADLKKLMAMMNKPTRRPSGVSQQAYQFK